ncbi:MAG TPA: hypothetical protein VIT41_10580 [Microlunatus sp.]
MQAMTIAIGKTGITKFLSRYLGGVLIDGMTGIRPPDRQFPVPDFGNMGAGYSDSFSHIGVALSGGSLPGFKPAFGSAVQHPAGTFDVSLAAPAFSVAYSWHEVYDETFCSNSSHGSFCTPSHGDRWFGYSAAVTKLDATFTLGFSYVDTAKAYRMTVQSSKATAGTVTPSIPAGSVVQNEDSGCFSAHVSDATATMVSAVDFGGLVAGSCNSLFGSIPASGHLTSDIVYQFAVGDSGLTYPSDTGVAVGVTGTVTFQGTEYPGAKPAALPVPVPPADTHDVRIYVSGYEVNALHWAYFRAGLLDVTVQPSDLPDPDVLKVKTYVAIIPELKPYAADAMSATVKPKAAPEVAFEDVWILTSQVMTTLKATLPGSVYLQLSGLDGNAYVDTAALESDLTAAGVTTTYFPQIESIAKSIGMALTQDLEFTITVQNGAQQPPVIVFDIKRHDILQLLGLGKTGAAQTMTYTFTRVDAAATFVSSTVPHFPGGANFGDLIWPVAGEPRYDEALAAMGKGAGVPLPIMSGFTFRFGDAVLSIQEGYLSILAGVDFSS